ncbi:hypothetical protein J437_LFUL008002 [Ladona fulva]|uniref:DNA-(apurinic or apyrimidinic site) endonuclease n=1 Tax=Ladona fulva TaxID=123851 RepID=A0A8K0NX46_LADFU|nr:hypothetical protein J437_LFUL008002 [Ladona fulva]
MNTDKMPPKGRKGTSAITKEEKVDKIDSESDSEKDPVEAKPSPSTKTVSKEEDEEPSNEDLANSEDEDIGEKKRETKKKSYKEESDEEEVVPKKRQSQRSTKPKAKMVDVSDEDFEEEEEEESEDEYVPPAASPRGRGRGQKKRKGEESDDSGSNTKKAKRPSKKPKRKPKRKDDSDFSEEDDSDEDWGSKKSRSRGSRGRKASAPAPTRRGERATRGRQNYAEEDDVESDGPAPKAKSKSKSVDKSEPIEAKSEGEDEQGGSGPDEEVKDADSKQANGRKDKGKAVDNENGMVEEPDEEDDDKEESKPSAKRKGEKAEKTPAKKVKETPDLSTVDFSCDKKTPDGKPWNLKISSWNVAGIRALIKKNGLEYVTAENPDIFCLQETKCPEKKLPPETKIEGYHTYWNSGDKDGHSGLGLYTKEKPLEVTYSIGDSELDSEGRLITAEYEKFYVVNAYVPNSGRGLVTLPKRLKWDTQFREYLKKLDEKKPVILCGDLNVSHQPIDLANPKTNTKNAGFTQEERDGFTKLLEEGFVDSFRQLYPDKTDAYTFWTNMRNARERNVGWRLDYFVLSKRLIPNLCENSIRSQVYGSDHCPLTLFINI